MFSNTMTRGGTLANPGQYAAAFDSNIGQRIAPNLDAYGAEKTKAQKVRFWIGLTITVVVLVAVMFFTP